VHGIKPLIPIREVATFDLDMGKDYVQKTIDPRNPEQGQAEVVIPYGLILNYYKFTPVRYLNLAAAKEVLEDPQRLFLRCAQRTGVTGTEV